MAPTQSISSTSPSAFVPSLPPSIYDTVIMEHPDLGPHQRVAVPRYQFNETWKRKGWEITKEPILDPFDSLDL